MPLPVWGWRIMLQVFNLINSTRNLDTLRLPWGCSLQTVCSAVKWQIVLCPVPAGTVSHHGGWTIRQKETSYLCGQSWHACCVGLLTALKRGKVHCWDLGSPTWYLSELGQVLELYGCDSTVTVGNRTFKPSSAGWRLGEGPVLTARGSNVPLVSQGSGAPHASPGVVLSTHHWVCIYGLPTWEVSLFNFPFPSLMFYGGIVFAAGCHSKEHLAIPLLSS